METVELSPNKINILCKVDWPAFGVGWPLEGLQDRAVINGVYREAWGRWQVEGGSRKRASYSEILERCWRHTLQA
jgi:hypothetical protein